VHAAVIKLNALPNAIGATPEDHDLFHGLWRGFAGTLVGGIQVGGVRHKFGTTGVDPLKRCRDVLLLAQGTEALRRRLELAIILGKEGREARIGKAILLGTDQCRVRQR
jgi:hypothetical protein